MIPGPSGDAVEVRTRHHDVGGGPCLRLGDHVAGALDAHAGVEFDGGLARVGAQLLAGRLRDCDDRNLHVGVGAERAAHLVAVDIVGDDQRDRTAFGGHGLLVAERTLAAVDEHDRTLDRQTVVVRRGAARRVLDAGGHQLTRHTVGPRCRW